MKLSDRLSNIEPQPDKPVRTAYKTKPEAPSPPTPAAARPHHQEAVSPPAVKPRSSAKRSNAGREDNKKRVRDLVLADLGPKLTGSKRVGDELEREVKAALDRALQREDVRISPVERSKFVAEVLSDILGYGPLDGPLADPTVTEIMCNAYNQIWVERKGVIEPTDLAFTDEGQYRQVIDKIVSAVGRRVDESSPMVDARL